jgi:pimeloyl-ACP methyl ester carboxylesterase
LTVPLDYDRPDGASIQIAVSRVRHTSPASQFQGVILVNPGGPGGPGLGLATLGQYVPNDVGAEYDWIGFDPRGVGASKPALSCVPDYFVGPRPPFAPTTRAIRKQWLARTKAFANACEAHAPALLRHMRTAESARDMDSIRAALGVTRISFYGFSYGTYLGQVYATLFPTRVRRMVFDSSIAPQHVWYRTTLRQDPAIERNIRIWFRWLAKYDDVYHLGKTESSVEQLFYEQDAALRRHPAATVLGPDEWEDAFYGAANSQAFWPLLGSFFSDWVHKHNPDGAIAAYRAFDTPGDDNAIAVYNAVTCTDARTPRRWRTWAADAWQTYRIAPFATWNNVWYSAPCVFWPVPAGKRIDVKGDHISALLIDETLDAGALYEDSLDVRNLFPDSRLLAEPGGTTHAGTLFGNACVDNHIAAYLATGALPARRPGRRADATCEPLPVPIPTANASVAAPARALDLARHSRSVGQSR